MTRHTQIIPVLLAIAAWPAWAQVSTAPQDMDSEKARIAAERKAVEVQYDKDRAQCYQKFAAQDCINDVRRKRRTHVEDLNHQEAAINDADRQRRGAAALGKLEEKAQPSPDDAAKREQALRSQQQRDEQAAQREADRKARDAESAANRRAFDDKQRAHAKEQAQQADKRAQEQADRERYEARLKQAEQDRAELEARNAKRTKPRGAPLPTPP